MANLVVNISEEVTLNGKVRGSENSLEISSVTQVLHRIVTCPANQDTTVANFHAATNTSDNALAVEDAKYIRLTNLHASNANNLTLQKHPTHNNTATPKSTTKPAKRENTPYGAANIIKSTI